MSHREVIEDLFSEEDHEAMTIPIPRREVRAALAAIHRRTTSKVDANEVRAMAEAEDARVRRVK